MDVTEHNYRANILAAKIDNLFNCRFITKSSLHAKDDDPRGVTTILFGFDLSSLLWTLLSQPLLFHCVNIRRDSSVFMSTIIPSTSFLQHVTYTEDFFLIMSKTMCSLTGINFKQCMTSTTFLWMLSNLSA